MIKFKFFTVKVLILLALYKLLLDFGYMNYVYPVFSYSGFDLDFNLLRYVYGWLMVVFGIFALERKSRNSLIYILFVVYLSLILPSSTYYAMGGGNGASYWTNCAAFFTVVLCLPTVKLTRQAFSSVKVVPGVMLAVFVFYIACLGYSMLSAQGAYVVNFADVYSYRAEHLERLRGVFGYFINWCMKVIAPFMLSIALIRRSTSAIVSAVILILALYAFSGHKSALVTIPLCFVFFFFLKDYASWRSDKFFVAFLASLIVLVGSSYLLFDYFEYVTPLSLVRRALFLPAYLNVVYFDYFSVVDFVYWANSFLASFVQYQFYGSVAHEIGAHIGHAEMWANTGFIASGFMQAGYWGVALYAVVMLVLNYFISKVAVAVHPVILNSLIAMPYLTLFISSDLPTTFLTHGFVLSVVLLLSCSHLINGNARLPDCPTVE